MPISPDTTAIYDEAIGLEDRVAAHTRRSQKLDYIQRQRIMELISDAGYQPDAGEHRWQIAATQANLELKETHADLYEEHDAEEAALRGIGERNAAIIAAGWAEQFATNSFMRGLSSRYDKEQQQKAELESGEESD